MKQLPIKEHTWRFLRAFFMTSASRHITGQTLSTLILSSLKLFPVAVAAQLTGMASLVLMFWSSEVSRFFLIFWFLCGLVQIWLSLRFLVSFWRDRRRVERIRIWIRRWTALAIYSGLIWGVAGPAFLLPLSGISQVDSINVLIVRLY